MTAAVSDPPHHDAGEPEYEPIAVEAHYPVPQAKVHPDTELGWFRRLSPLWRVRWKALVLVTTSGLLSIAANNAVPLTVRSAIDNAIDGSDGSSGDLNGYVIRLVVLGVVLAVCRGVYRYAIFRVAYQIETDLRDQVYQHLTTLSFSFYDRTASGDVISRANSDIRSIQLLFAFGPMAALMVVSFLLAFVLMLTLHVGLTLVVVAVMPLVFITAQHMRNQVFPLTWITQARTAEVAMVVDENINGTRVVKAFAAEQQQVTTLAKAAQRLRWSSIETIDTRARLNPIIEALPRLALAIVVLYGGILAIDEKITVGTIVAFTTYIIIISVPFRMFGFLLMQSQRAAASAGRIYEILDTEPEIADPPGAIDLVDPRGAVRYDNVTFTYPSSVGGADGRPSVLRDFTLDVAAGETVAIVGRTGSGKSTIIRLLPRFYDPDVGTISIDGHNVNTLTLTSLRHHVGLVLDEPFLFSTSVRDNIAFGRPNADIDQIVAAAKAAQAHGFISDLAEGYDTVVGERGYTLSGGQRQRIAIARTLLMNPKVLVLDDATSAIDVQVEDKIHQALAELMSNRTTIVIAHRMSTISLADRVVLLEDGAITASGSHAELLATVPEYAEVLATVEQDQDDADVDDVDEPSAPADPASNEGGS